MKSRVNPDYSFVRSDIDVIRNKIDRVFMKDSSLWPASSLGSEKLLGWLESPERAMGSFQQLFSSADSLREGLSHVVLIGQGGSILGARAIVQFADVVDELPISIIDSTHPIAISNLKRTIDFEKTLFIISSKSGSTLETVALFKYFFDLTRGHLGDLEAGKRFIAITDRGSPLEKTAVRFSFKEIVRGFNEVGGRYSALTPFGLYPAVLKGVNAKKILEGAIEAKGKYRDGNSNDSLVKLISMLIESLKERRDTVLIVSDESLTGFAFWIQQLLAESLGKNGRGILPFLGFSENDFEYLKRDYSLVRLKRISSPNFECDTFSDTHVSGTSSVIRDCYDNEIADEKDLGSAIIKWQIATAVIGSLIEVNPFDQPEVESSKEATRYFLENRETLKKNECDSSNSVELMLGNITGEDYLAILVYLNPDPNIERSLKCFSQKVMAIYGIPVSYTFGPSYLHSTGQFHKGGPKTGKFIQILDTGIEGSTRVPCEEYDFSDLIQCQADGDLKALQESGQEIVRIRVDGDLDLKLDTVISRSRH